MPTDESLRVSSSMRIGFEPEVVSESLGAARALLSYAKQKLLRFQRLELVSMFVARRSALALYTEKF